MAAPTEPEIECPKCSTLMQRVYVEAIVVDRCPTCGGLWLDVNEMERLLERPQAARQVDSGPRESARIMNKVTHVHCPRDGAAMSHRLDAAQRHIGYECCGACGGVFLDAGELHGLSETTLLERLKHLLGR